MKQTIYLFSNGTLSRKDNSLCFETEEGKRHIPITSVNEIYAFGEVDFNTRLVNILSQQEIILHYFNYYGYYMGSFYPREHFNSGYVTLRQAEHYLETQSRLNLARLFVDGSISNILQVLRYYRRREKAVDDSLLEIEVLAEKIDKVADIETLMSVEGNVREIYYRAFDNILQHDEFVFEKRTRRPPKNNLNTLISFGNAMLYTICLSEIYKTHLDPRIGFLHATNFRRFSLNLDVAEIFKPIIIDRLIFSLVGKGMIQGKDFVSEAGGLLMSEKARKTYVSELEAKLKTTIKHRQIGRAVSYRRLIRLELYKLVKHIMAEKKYQPFVARW